MSAQIISRKNLVRRVNRTLAHQGQKLVTNQIGLMVEHWGRHYVVNLAGGPSAAAIVKTHINLTRFARELGALRKGEGVRKGK